MTYILRTHQLTKNYRGMEVVSGVSMNIRQGEIYGFLGPNGAGKTTVMKMMTNLVKPTSGEIEILGEKLTPTSYEVLKRMGSIIENPIFYENFTAQENLELHCEYMGYYNKNAIPEALELVKLKNVERKRVKEFSLGMKQRLGIARAISTKPELLILDEPINGLDPVGIRELRDLFHLLSRQYGITLLISSHILGEMEQIADTIGVIREGKLLEEVPMDAIRGRQTEYMELHTPDITKAAFLLENGLNVTNFRIIEGSSVIKIYDLKIPQSEMAKALIMNGVSVDSFYKKSHSLEDYFLQLIKGGGQHDASH
ncbi:ABC transporter ATP-binding protein [Paenibacillus nasutitermitis]|uniref:Bacitracin ABC transporter ATP-binding protein n=1 Tax=Paenibacillus nasutitermitis TaxID=1652958 RepID=A0A917DQI1_9BACL|nr:ABC transporter ATP-binding protein [Paenibacillus nasutitermitis]GGD59607.1 bacitracin ABC transporter ATP-binding protein [Paenibacillus nasutitermitis]